LGLLKERDQLVELFTLRRCITAVDSGLNAVMGVVL
jgi:hypothetical protein